MIAEISAVTRTPQGHLCFDSNEFITLGHWQPKTQQRQLVSRVNNTFWLLCEVRRYGAGCSGVSPVNLRERAVDNSGKCYFKDNLSKDNLSDE